MDPEKLANISALLGSSKGFTPDLGSTLFGAPGAFIANLLTR